MIKVKTVTLFAFSIPAGLRTDQSLTHRRRVTHYNLPLGKARYSKGLSSRNRHAPKGIENGPHPG